MQIRGAEETQRTRPAIPIFLVCPYVPYPPTHPLHDTVSILFLVPSRADVCPVGAPSTL